MEAQRNRIQRLIRKLLPTSQENRLRAVRHILVLNRTSPQEVDIMPLLKSSAISFAELFGDDLADEWEATAKAIGEVFEYAEKDGSISVGDRQVIWTLIRRFKPCSVLEIGTSIGGSTLHIAMALKACRHTGTFPRLVSVDRDDVNEVDAQCWARAGVSGPPKDMLTYLGCAEMVEFVTARSLDYLAGRAAEFDFIFLDGDHGAGAVYQEIPLALRALRPGGCILLHDYFPEMRPLGPNNRVIPGPYLAVERLRRENAGLTVLPLGTLPWPQQLGTPRVTTLAFLARA